MNVSRLVIRAEANKESWTMPITGLLDWGDTMFLGTIMICSSSALAATDCGTCLRGNEGSMASTAMACPRRRRLVAPLRRRRDS